ncbi:hypothetical protein, partial [Salmonella enterica]|uniref:hypothetical protein n=1 Tax=Salmonella enterica TaxID=28901 RepID=UPI001C0A85DE
FIGEKPLNHVTCEPAASKNKLSPIAKNWSFRMKITTSNYLIYNKKPHLIRWDTRGKQNNEREHCM